MHKYKIQDFVTCLKPSSSDSMYHVLQGVFSSYIGSIVMTTHVGPCDTDNSIITSVFTLNC